jgi:hypothetical protein
LASLRLRDFALKKTINAKAQGRQGAKGRTDRSDFRDKIFFPNCLSRPRNLIGPKFTHLFKKLGSDLA